MDTPGRRVLDPDQAAEFLNVSRRWIIREGVQKGRVPYLRPPGSNQYRFLESDLWKVLESWRENGNDRIGNPPRADKRAKRKGRNR